MTGITISAEYVAAFGEVAYVARETGLPVGYLTFTRGDDEVTVELGEVEVKASHRRQGVADALLARLRSDHASYTVKGGTGFTAEGAAWWLAATGEVVRVTQRIEPGSGAWDAE